MMHGKAPRVKPKISVLEVPIDSSLRCRFCKQAFTGQSNRRRHEEAVHLAHLPESSLCPTSIICKECDEEEVVSFSRLGRYREHLQRRHGIPTRKVDYEFSSTQGKYGE